jgi:hypothetical protein
MVSAAFMNHFFYGSYQLAIFTSSL